MHLSYKKLQKETLCDIQTISTPWGLLEVVQSKIMFCTHIDNLEQVSQIILECVSIFKCYLHMKHFILFSIVFIN